MSAAAIPRLTREQYLAIERAAHTKSEFYDGRMYAMSGGTRPHARIIANSITAVSNALVNKPCEVNSGDLRVQAGDLHTYPDISINCAEAHLADGHRDMLLNPTVLVEVLSPSTESYDRGFKFQQYRKIESLREYVLIWQSEPRVEVFRRQPAGQPWLWTEYAGLGALCRWESLDCEIPLASIYDRVRFEASSDHPSGSADLG